GTNEKQLTDQDKQDLNIPPKSEFGGDQALVESSQGPVDYLEEFPTSNEGEGPTDGYLTEAEAIEAFGEDTSEPKDIDDRPDPFGAIGTKDQPPPAPPNEETVVKTEPS
ncbi:MAG TPA: hypothetical protein DCM40_13290, partial [Maribacter sp.]|nr:hypothetical protein [Maribacter sp.]